MVCSDSHQEEDLEVRVDQEDQGGQVAPVVEDQAVLREHRGGFGGPPG